MPPRKYAEGTTVSVDSSQSEMRLLLRKYGSTEFGLFEGADRQAVQFTLYGQQYRFVVLYPTKDWADDQTMMLPHYSKYDETIRNIQEREWKRRWRGRLIWLKATLEFAVGEEDDSMRNVLGAFAVLVDGRTVGEALAAGSLPLRLSAGE